MATKVDLRERALQSIQWLARGQTPNAYEAARADEVIDECYAYLESEGIAYWPENDIPEAVMFGLVDYVAGRLARRLMSVEQAAPYSSLVEIGLTNMRRCTATRGTNRSTTHRFF